MFVRVYVFWLHHVACGTSLTGIKPMSPAVEAYVLTPGSPGNSLGVLLIHLLQLATLSLSRLWPNPNPPSHLHLANSDFPQMEVYLLQAFFLNLCINETPY